jgi:hypothetical protein
VRNKRRRLSWLAAVLIGLLLAVTPGASAAQAAPPQPIVKAAIIGTGGTSVMISGVNFGTNATVLFSSQFGDVLIPPATKCTTGQTGCLVSRSTTTITVKAPTSFPFGEPMGFIPILVCSNGTSIATCTTSVIPAVAKGAGFPAFVPGFVYGPAVTKMAPLAGKAGTAVTLTGGKFGTTIPTINFVNPDTWAVVASFGGPSATTCTTGQKGCVSSRSDTSIKFVVPDNLPPARYWIDVITGGEAPSFATFLTPPFFSTGAAVLSNTPAGGQAGAKVTIKGVNFGTGTPVVVTFLSIGPNFSNVSVTAACTATLIVGCFSAAHTADTITLSAPANDPTGATFTQMQITVSGVSVDDLTPVPASYFQSTLTFSYGPLITGSTALLHAKAGAPLQIKGVNFGPLAGVQLGNSTSISRKCNLFVTHTCIAALTDTSITVKPPPDLTGEVEVQPVWAIGGFRMIWGTGPAVTNIS